MLRRGWARVEGDSEEGCRRGATRHDGVRKARGAGPANEGNFLFIGTGRGHDDTVDGEANHKTPVTDTMLANSWMLEKGETKHDAELHDTQLTKRYKMHCPFMNETAKFWTAALESSRAAVKCRQSHMVTRGCRDDGLVR